MKPGCIGKSNTNKLPAPTDLTENPYGKKPRSGKSNLSRTHVVKEMYTYYEHKQNKLENL